MRVLVISANSERINMLVPPLGAAMVAAAARSHGHEVELLDLLAADDPLAAARDAVEAVGPDVIGISVRNIDDQNMDEPGFLLERAAEVVRACRTASTAPLVVGGAGYSIFPVPALAYLEADFGIAGEGEVAFPALLAALGSGDDPARLPGVVVRGETKVAGRAPQPTLDVMPSPYDDLERRFDLSSSELWLPVQTRRGCPLDCSYCSTPQIEGRNLRMRSPAAVADELARLADAGAERFHFVDNTFNLPPTYALELCREIVTRGRAFAWRAIVYPHLVSKQLVEAMAAAGCVEVSLGHESCSDPILASLNKRFTVAEVREAADLFAAAGVRRVGFLMLGVPGETRETVLESLDAADALGLELLKITVGVRIYPFTPLAARAVAEGVVAADDDLLRPRFYLAPAVAEWVREAVAARKWATPVVM